jgi:hypothetical protein
VFINEGADNQWSGLYHYYHFTAEAMLGGLASIASWAASVDWPRPAPLPGADQIVIPWDKRWHDRHGLNEMVVHGIWDERVVDTDEWAKLADKWLYFERSKSRVIPPIW